MSALIPTLAEAIKDAINAASVAGDLAFNVTAVRRWLPIVDLKELRKGLVVLVVAKGIENTVLTRAKDQEIVSIDVGVLKLLDESTDREAETDVVFQLIDEIHGVLRTGFDSVPASYLGRASDPIFDIAKMHEEDVLRAATTYRYQVHRDVRI